MNLKNNNHNNIINIFLNYKTTNINEEIKEKV